MSEENSDQQQQFVVSPVARPLAGEKFEKKTLKLIIKSKKAKKINRGVKECVKSIKKSTPGICVLAGDVYPVEVYAHIPAMCEEKNIPYYFIRSRRMLGSACGTRKSTSVVFIPKPAGDSNYHEDFDKLYEKAEKTLQEVQTYVKVLKN